MCVVGSRIHVRSRNLETAASASRLLETHSKRDADADGDEGDGDDAADGDAARMRAQAPKHEHKSLPDSLACMSEGNRFRLLTPATALLLLLLLSQLTAFTRCPRNPVASEREIFLASLCAGKSECVHEPQH